MLTLLLGVDMECYIIIIIITIHNNIDHGNNDNVNMPFSIGF